MQNLRTTVIGTGFMGKVHTEAIRRLGNVEIAAIVGSTDASARRAGEALGIARATADLAAVLADPSIQAVHICTPNALHYPMSKAALEAGKAVLCEKPLTLNEAQARELAELAQARGVANCVNHNLRCYPLVQQVRRMVQNGELGEVLIVDGTYFQDWLLYDTDYNWRVEEDANGSMRAMGDIGSHWMDTIQHVTGLKITAVCADLQTFHRRRRKPRGAVETFSGKLLRPEDYSEIPTATDDFGAVLLRLGERARGCFAVSQMSAGRKNRFAFEVYGTKGGAAWNQERPDELWIGERNAPNRILIKDPSLLDPRAAAYADLPGGHSEGYDDTHKQMFRRFYRRVADASAPEDYPTFADGLWGMRLLETVGESSRRDAWVEVEPAE
jgi:predicted dehydrogenase